MSSVKTKSFFLFCFVVVVVHSLNILDDRYSFYSLNLSILKNVILFVEELLVILGPRLAAQYPVPVITATMAIARNTYSVVFAILEK